MNIVKDLLSSSGLALLFILAIAGTLSTFQQQEAEPKQFPIHSVFADEIPAVESGQVILQTHEYLACLDPVRRQPVWVAYTISPADFDTENVLSRNFSTPEKYRDISLESSDFDNSGWANRGHSVALKSKSASRYAFEINWMMVITIQDKDLNQGPLLKLETRIRNLAGKNNKPLQIFYFNIFEGSIGGFDLKNSLPNADEDHEAPSHCGMIIRSESDGVECYVIPQDCELKDTPVLYGCTLKEAKSLVSETWWGSE